MGEFDDLPVYKPEELKSIPFINCPCGWHPHGKIEIEVYRCAECEEVLSVFCAECDQELPIFATKCRHRVESIVFPEAHEEHIQVTVVDGSMPCGCTGDCERYFVEFEDGRRGWVCETYIQKEENGNQQDQVEEN